MLRFGDHAIRLQRFQTRHLSLGEFDLPLGQSNRLLVLQQLFIHFFDVDSRLSHLTQQPLNFQLIIAGIDLQQQRAGGDEHARFTGLRFQPHPASHLSSQRHFLEWHHHAIQVDFNLPATLSHHGRLHRHRRTCVAITPRGWRLTAHGNENGSRAAQNGERRNPAKDASNHVHARDSGVVRGSALPRAASAKWVM